MRPLPGSELRTVQTLAMYVIQQRLPNACNMCFNLNCVYFHLPSNARFENESEQCVLHLHVPPTRNTVDNEFAHLILSVSYIVCVVCNAKFLELIH